MLWTPCMRKTRSGTVFAAWTPAINTLCATDFDFAPLVAAAVAAQVEDQEDEEPHDHLDDIDEEWLPNPLNEVDDLPLLSCSRKRPASPTFDDLLATGQPHKGCHRRRAAKHMRSIQEEGYVPHASIVAEHVKPAVPLHMPSLDAIALPATHSVYAGRVEDKDEKYGAKKRRSLAELISLGFQLVRWDGITARPLVDNAGRIFAVLAGQPDNDRWRRAVSRAYGFIKAEGMGADFPAAMRKHRRGLFAAINIGLGYGKGQRLPTWMDNKQHTPMVNRLLAHPDVNRLANFASSAFSMWAPRLHAHYVKNNAELKRQLPHLNRPFPKSVFASAAFNFGPRVWTFKHRNICNLAFGWCAIQSLRPFNAVKGGHLVLWDLKMVVEFPAGALILLPSATVSHSNVALEVGEERISFTQFTAGGLFRWVDNGGRTLEELEREDPDEWQHMQDLKDTRWETGLSYFSTVDKLLETE
ncbi:hypothetical protein B0H14DRAFT_3487824 [Mycena olivaceomarginata]|nr:hypothetical protein B0H14DRAFT_3487824 [Mycena olivaceomarginata]